jgi:hypothetical protein
MNQTQDRGRWEFPQAAGAVAPAVEMRKSPRFPMTSAVRVGWVDCQRQMRYVTAQGVDISENGLAVRLPVQLRHGALLNLELAHCGISAVGRVRYCVMRGGEWRVGMELTNSFASDGASADGIETESLPE